MASVVDIFKTVADAIAALIHPHAEVVLHRLDTGKIEYIANSFSGRRAGDDSLTDFQSVASFDQSVIGPYLKTNWDGRSLKSVSAVLTDGSGKPVGLLCINLDVSALTTLHAVVGDMLRCAGGAQQPSVLFNSDWREQVNMIVGAFLTKRGLTIDSLQPADRDELATELDNQGIFEMRNGAAYVAKLLGVSRATFYKSLRAARLGTANPGYLAEGEAAMAGRTTE